MKDGHRQRESIVEKKRKYKYEGGRIQKIDSARGKAKKWKLMVLSSSFTPCHGCIAFLPPVCAC